jgi:LPXTG-site transpeptidase (sortase) family protein
LGIDSPLNLSQYKDVKDFTNWNFDEELTRGVVLYPTTPVPWNVWNTLIFWHTSQEFWKMKDNPYWNVFINIPKLEVWNEIKVVWKWKLYTYSVINKVIKTPKQVNVEYLKYQDGNYVTLMWCYPIGTDKERIMVIGKLIGE